LLSAIYETYYDFRNCLKEWSKILWAKLDAEVLRVGSEEFDKKRKKLARQYEDNLVFMKFSKTVIEFKESIPLIQQLKSGSVTDRH